MENRKKDGTIPAGRGICTGIFQDIFSCRGNDTKIPPGMFFLEYKNRIRFMGLPNAEMERKRLLPAGIS